MVPLTLEQRAELRRYAAELSLLDTEALCRRAYEKALEYYGTTVTYSPKVFIPLTKLCRDVCHYCTFATTPSRLESPFLSLNEVLSVASQGERVGCHEALFTLGEKPELRYRIAREWLAERGFHSTVDYLIAACREVLAKTSLLPHVNAGNLTSSELKALKPYVASIGIMLESGDKRLLARDGAHYGSPDKIPVRRMTTLARAGRLGIPVTTGLLIGIGESVAQRLEDMITLTRLHARYGHIQEVIIQNFRAKTGTKMAHAEEVSTDELLRTVALARLLLPSSVSVQVPPNLNSANLASLLSAGINDWGGISPVTPDHVNPEAPWPAVDVLRHICIGAGRTLIPRMPVYGPYLTPGAEHWLHPDIRQRVLARVDAEGLLRNDTWIAGDTSNQPLTLSSPRLARASVHVADLVSRRCNGAELTQREVAALFQARDIDLEHICRAADDLRAKQVGDMVTYVVNRNINYTNVCQYACHFCAFSKGLPKEHGRERPYDITSDELRRRTREAWNLGATEVCLQGGIHPNYTGDTYLSIVRAVTDEVSDIHVHAFSPLEVQQGADTLGWSVIDYLAALKETGLRSLPGTAAEILDDRVRAIICPDKLSTKAWLDVMANAHSVGLRSTATMMFGHVDRAEHWANHLLHIRQLQQMTGGFTEFVPLPFVPAQAPIFRRGMARSGPTRREVILVHAIARLVLGDVLANIQASWVKLGHQGALDTLDFGVNDLGGCLMNESISRAAGAGHGQCWHPEAMVEGIRSVARQPLQRTTLYGRVAPEQAAKLRRDTWLLASTHNPSATLAINQNTPRTF